MSERLEMYPMLLQALDDVDHGKCVDVYPDDYINWLVSLYANGTSRRQVLVAFSAWAHGESTANVDKGLVEIFNRMCETLDAHTDGCVDEAVAMDVARIAIACLHVAQMLGFDLNKLIDQRIQYDIKRKEYND